MHKSWLTGLAFLTLSACVPSIRAQKVEATVLYRQNSDNYYTALVPGYSGNTVDCAAEITNPACSSPASAAAPGQPNLSVTGTTVSLLLPDGKVAVVNCANKYSYKGTYINRRSCAMPLVEHVEANFDGRKAKLKWSIGPDDRWTENETYKLIALLDRR